MTSVKREIPDRGGVIFFWTKKSYKMKFEVNRIIDIGIGYLGGHLQYSTHAEFIAVSDGVGYNITVAYVTENEKMKHKKPDAMDILKEGPGRTKK
jgi:hypothetical protein